MRNTEIRTRLDLPTPELQAQVTQSLQAFIISLRELVPAEQNYFLEVIIDNQTEQS